MEPPSTIIPPSREKSGGSIHPPTAIFPGPRRVERSLPPYGTPAGLPQEDRGRCLRKNRTPARGAVREHVLKSDGGERQPFGGRPRKRRGALWRPPRR